MIVTIDGPAGAGKSTVARGLAERLGFDFLDTGAMYRAVAWAALDCAIELQDDKAIVDVAKRMRIEFRDQRIYVDGKDVSEQIRSPQITESVRFAASNSQVRDVLVDQQRRIGGRSDNLVTEGRDQGTVVFPQAECKIFLTATPEERAKRRHRELLANGQDVTFEEILASQNQRDAGDSEREIAPLVAASDAIEVYTDRMAQDEVLSHLESIVRQKMP